VTDYVTVKLRDQRPLRNVVRRRAQRLHQPSLRGRAERGRDHVCDRLAVVGPFGADRHVAHTPTVAHETHGDPSDAAVRRTFASSTGNLSGERNRDGFSRVIKLMEESRTVTFDRRFDEFPDSPRRRRRWAPDYGNV
jgi:hypothetical protein